MSWLTHLMRNVRVEAERDRSNGLGTWDFSTCLAVLTVLLTFNARPAAAEPTAKTVLVLFSSFGRTTDYLDSLERPIRARVPGQITFYEAYLDDSQAEYESSWGIEAEVFRRRYARLKLDLVIAAYPQAVLFAQQYRDKIFPGVPIVFTGISTKLLEERKLWPGMTGVVEKIGVPETVDLALHLHPETTTVAIIAGTSAWDQRWLTAAHSELVHYGKVKEIDVTGSPSDQMVARVATLPPHTVVLYQMQPHRSSQPTIGALDLLPSASQHFPTYSVFPSDCLNHGCIGGVDIDSTETMLRTEEIAIRVLLGEQPEVIPVAVNSHHQVRVDWRALQRWHISESALPTGTLILYRPPSFWESYRRYVIGTVVVIAFLLLLIAGLLWERTRSRKAEAHLRESEKRFRVMADTTPSLVWMCDPKGKVTYLNERSTAFTGSDSAAGYSYSWTAYVHPDDLKNVKDGMSQELKDHRSFSREYRLRRNDGVYRWMFDVASPRVNGDGSFAGFIGSAIDVTEQKLAQQALEQVSGQLIEAQEKERSRIARDLHDDICQRLALLSMEIEQANRVSSRSPAHATQSLEEIRRHCSEIAGDVQSLSHQLHSSKLEYLGVAAAIRGFCHEFSRQHELSIAFTEENVPCHLPKDISLCLFRVVQEALHNAVKYSGVGQFAVELTATPDDIQLAVSDSGRGFDVEEARKNRGLGLVSMQERVHLVHGQFSVESKPGMGTRVLAIVPLTAENQSQYGTIAMEMV
jgi:PAS domain S-box-containing protein